METLLKNSQESERIRETYLHFCYELIEAFYSIFKDLHKQEGFEPSLEIDKKQWTQVMRDLFCGVCSNFTYYKEETKEIDHIAARLFFTKIKQHAGDKGLRDGNKRSAILAVIIHYAAYRWVVERNTNDEDIDLSISSEDMYKKSKEIAEIDSMTMDDDIIVYQLEEWFNTDGSSNLVKRVYHFFLNFMGRDKPHERQ